jgi:hypothetical protein
MRNLKALDEIVFLPLDFQGPFLWSGDSEPSVIWYILNMIITAKILSSKLIDNK